MKNGWITSLACLLAGGVLYGTEAGPVNLGNVMFVGDSITHGFGTSSYRWQLHKILVDNGVKFTVVGVTQDNLRPAQGTPAGTLYAGVAFNNRHSAMSSERAWEVAGRRNNSGRLGNSNIFDWLGLDASYTGPYRIEPSTQMPDVFVLLIGTNDTFSDYGRRGGFGRPDFYEEVSRNLLAPGGDMDTIIGAMRRVNPQARILVLSIPTWHDGTPHSNAPADYEALNRLNREIAAWAAERKLELVDVNQGLVDVTRADKPGVGEAQFFCSRDHLHPTAQGDLLIASTVAKALGVGGRSVGLSRKDMSEFELVAEASGHFSQDKWEALSVKDGVTLTVKGAAVGNGAADGWEKEKQMVLNFCRKDAECCAVLRMSESAIVWGNNTILYRGDMSQNTDELRVAWVPAPEGENRTPGFYVWLGDRLIGEALPGLPKPVLCRGSYASVTFPGESPAPVLLRATTGAWAPPAL